MYDDVTICMSVSGYAPLLISIMDHENSGGQHCHDTQNSRVCRDSTFTCPTVPCPRSKIVKVPDLCIDVSGRQVCKIMGLCCKVVGLCCKVVGLFCLFTWPLLPLYLVLFDTDASRRLAHAVYAVAVEAKRAHRTLSQHQQNDIAHRGPDGGR